MSEVRRIIEVVPYDHNWKIEFAKIRDMLDIYIGDLIITIEHVGSTSVEGLVAKPIIDIDVVIESYAIFPIIVERLGLAGFIHEGDLGIEGREVFKRTVEDGLMKYHLYVCHKDGKGYLEHIAFRNYLRANSDAKEEYGLLKIGLAKEYRYDIDNYISHKTDFISGVLLKTIYKENQ